MSESTEPTTTPTTIEQPTASTNAASESSAVAPEMQELLNQLKEQSATNAALRQKHDASAAQLEALSAKITDYQSAGKRKRETALNGAVKQWMDQMVKTHSDQLGPHETKLRQLMESMKNNDEADPMVQMLACAATASNTSTTKLNEAYQHLKQEQEANKRLKAAVEEATKPAFASSSDRFQPPAPTPEPKAPQAQLDMFARVTARPNQGRGMASTNPGLWNAIRQTASNMPGGNVRRPGIDMSIYSARTRNALLPEVAKEWDIRN